MLNDFDRPAVLVITSVNTITKMQGKTKQWNQFYIYLPSTSGSEYSLLYYIFHFFFFVFFDNFTNVNFSL